MAQRMDEVGGICRISGKPGAGCRVEFDLPATAKPNGLPGGVAGGSRRRQSPRSPGSKAAHRLAAANAGGASEILNFDMKPETSGQAIALRQSIRCAWRWWKTSRKSARIGSG